MAGEFDSLRVKIESNSDKARNNIGYLVTALSDLRKITGLTNDSLRETNGLLREMRDHFKAFKSMGDPFAGFSRGAEKASRNAQKFRDAMAGTSGDTKASANAIVVWGNNSTTAIVKVTQALWDAKSAFDALKNATGRGSRFGGFLGDKDKDIIDGEYRERRAFNTSSPHFVWARSKNQTADQRNAWVTESWRRRNATRGREAEVEKAYEYFRERRDYLSAMERIQSLNPPTTGIRKSAKDISILKPIFESVKKSALSLVKTLGKIPIAIGRGAINTITAPFRAVGNAISGATERAKRFFASIKRIAVYRLIRSALKAMTQAMREGIDNLYQWSLAVNTSFAPAMNSIATDLLYVKNALGAMISPLIEAFAPIMRGIADSLVSAFNWVQRVLSQLMGRDHWYKAIRVQTQYQEATNNTTKAVKKLRDEIHLMDWDEINNITENDDNGTGAAVANPVTPNPSEMFVQVEQPLEALEGNNFWERLWSLIKKGWESLKEWWNGVDWVKLGKTIGEKIMGAWNTFTGWWNDHKAEIGAGILKVVTDIYKFFAGLFESIDWKKIATDLGAFVGDVWNGLSTWFSQNKEEIWSGIVSVLKGIWDFIATAVDSFLSVIDPYHDTKKVAKEYGKAAAEAEKNANGISGDYSGMTNQEAYNAATNDIEEINKSVRELNKGREQINNEITALLTDEEGFYDAEKRARYDRLIAQNETSLANNGERDIDFAREFNGNEEFVAYVKLRGALDNLNNAYTKVTQKRKQIAHTAQMLGKIEVGAFTTANEKIQDALIEQNDIITSGMGELAADALDSYITSVNWGNGGVITARGIADALYKAGLPRAYADEAGRDIFGYLTGTYNGKGWHDIDSETVEVIKNSISEANIPGEYKVAAYDALMSYISSVDWENGGRITASGIEAAFVAVGIPAEVARQAALSVTNWYTKFNPEDVGEKTASKMIASLQSNLSIKAKSLKIALDSLQIGKIPTITVPVNYKLPKALLTQNIEVNYRGSSGNLLQKSSGKIEAYFRANGGFVPQGSLFVAGEVPGQAEMVGNINGKTGVVSGREISGIGDAVWSTGNTTANILGQILTAIQNKNLTISPSAALGQTVAKSSRLYAMQTG